MLAKKYITLLVSSVFLSGAVFAQSITLYDQPNQTAKVVGTADLASGIIPIFTPEKNNDWIKVADPRNGNVGWIKSSDIKNARGSENTVTFSQKIISNGSKPTYQVIQFGNPPMKMTDEQAKAYIEKMQKKQQELQQSFQGIMKNMNEVIQNQWNMWNAQGGFPMIIMPAPAKNVTAPALVKPVTTQTKPAS